MIFLKNMVQYMIRLKKNGLMHAFVFHLIPRALQLTAGAFL